MDECKICHDLFGVDELMGGMCPECLSAHEDFLSDEEFEDDDHFEDDDDHSFVSY